MAITQEKAEKIAQCYEATSFLNKEKALLNAGYKPSYARSGLSNKIYSNVLVKKEINKIRSKIEEKAENSREFVTKEFMELAKKCKEKEDRVNLARCLENLGKNVGWYAEDNEQRHEEAELTELQRADLQDFIEYKRRKLLRQTG